MFHALRNKLHVAESIEERGWIDTKKAEIEAKGEESGSRSLEDYDPRLSKGEPLRDIASSTHLSLSMCLFNDNKLPNESVQSYSIIATTVVAARLSGSLVDESFREVRIREKVEGEKAPAITGATA